MRCEPKGARAIFATSRKVFLRKKSEKYETQRWDSDFISSFELLDQAVTEAGFTQPSEHGSQYISLNQFAFESERLPINSLSLSMLPPTRNWSLHFPLPVVLGNGSLYPRKYPFITHCPHGGMYCLYTSVPSTLHWAGTPVGTLGLLIFLSPGTDQDENLIPRLLSWAGPLSAVITG